MKEFIRNFKKQRTVGWLNISSLSLGIMVAIVIGLWAINELSFDRFHKNRDRIYRAAMEVNINNVPTKMAQTFRTLGDMAKNELPAIEDMCRIVMQNEDISIDNVLYREVGIYLTDPNFFSFFTFPLKVGDLGQALSSPDRVVISESAAQRYFPGQDPIGQIIKLDGYDFSVSGVMKDMPKNSSMQTDFVFPFFSSWATYTWSNDRYISFFLLQKGTTADAMAEQLTQIMYKGFEPLKNAGVTFSLEALTDMHFSAGFTFESIVKGNKSLVMIFVVTALVIEKDNKTCKTVRLFCI